MAEPNQTGATGGEVNLPESHVLRGDKTVPENLKAATETPAVQVAPLPEQMTLRQFRALRAKYFTVKHKRMEPCGHRLDTINEPRFNCEFCWFAFFQTHGELVQTTDRAYQEQGAAFLDKMRGVKYRKMFLRFMSTMAMFQKEFEAAKGKTDGQSGTDQSGERVGQSVGQNLQDQGNSSEYGQESGPVTASIPDPITLG